MNKETLIAFYKKIDGQYKVTNGLLETATYISNSNFTLSAKYPRHRWYYYKEGFSPVLVESLLEEFGATQDSVICDPFCGAGTTLAVAQANGMKAIGFEVNPFAVLITTVKTRNYSADDIATFRTYVEQLLELPLDVVYDVPTNEYLCRLFNDKMLSVQQNIKAYISALPQNNAKDILYFTWLSTLEECSLYRKAGNGLKKKTHKPDFMQGEKEYALKAIQERVAVVLQDISPKPVGPEPDIYCDSAVYMDKRVNNESLDIVIFSPPYANCFDYTKIYYLELWFGGFVNNREEQKAIRMKSVRSHVHTTWPDRFTNFYLSELNDTIIPLIAEENLWTKRIPAMLNGYFADMEEALRQIYNALRPGGNCAIVVSNSAYAGIVVPTDIFLAMIAERLGFVVKEIQVERLIITSSQQYRETEYARKYLRESIVKLHKPGV
ncbi:MAG: DNA methyltransferase [Thermoanaerobacteraceae bacterium]|nr:DNA methyltransferase [Thermoanaerobacteraceae bacterium]